MEFIQFHPTVLWSDTSSAGQQPLISEAVRGEGAILLNHKGERFMAAVHPQADLAPRDIVAKEIFSQMREAHVPHMWLDATGIPDFRSRFPTIYASCAANGIDPERQLIPVAPASHYASGGVLVDLHGQSSVPGLYVCGESACTGAHGANRLASNSLLEGLVFGARISEQIANNLPEQLEPFEDPLEERILIDPSIRIPLQLAMSQGAGVMRSAKSLKATLATLEQLGMRRVDEPGVDTWEVSNLYYLATAIVRSALERDESRGSHWRSDYLETSAAWEERIIQKLTRDGLWNSSRMAVKK